MKLGSRKWRETEIQTKQKQLTCDYAVVFTANSRRLTDYDIRAMLSCSVPMDIPADFVIHLDSVNSTGAEFSWRSVDSSRQRVQGVFTGYQVSS